jgi:predicted TPR repeat methyltransferase
MAISFCHYQIDHFTKPNRYPELFSCCANLKKNAERVLSFGCSTGEECRSLRDYFPSAHICGLDIDSSIAIAKSRNFDERTTFTTMLDGATQYDAIFCMSVFTKWPDLKDKVSCSGLLDFSDFEKDIGRLLFLLKTNGLIVLFNSSFAIEDTKYGWCLKPIECPYKHGVGWVPVYDRYNSIKTKGSHSIFVKTPRVL